MPQFQGYETGSLVYRYTDIQNKYLVNSLKNMAEKTPDKETAFLLEYSDSEIFKWNYTNIGPSYNSLP